MEAKKEKKVTLRGVFRTVLKYATYIGSGAVAGCALKGVDISGLKGVAKACAGLGILGITTAVADAASESIGKKFDDVTDLADDLSKEDDEDVEVIDDVEVVDVNV